MKYMRKGLRNFDKYTVRPRIMEGVKTGILAIGPSFGHYRRYIVFSVEDDLTYRLM